MGIDFHDDQFTENACCSYSNFQIHRRELIECYLLYLQHVINNPNQYPDLHEIGKGDWDLNGTQVNFLTHEYNEIKQWLGKLPENPVSNQHLLAIMTSGTGFTGIHYKKIGIVCADALRLGSAGLYYFVNCSDCYGVHNLSECEYIFKVIECAKPYLIEKHYTSDQEDPDDWWQSIQKVFRVAIENKGFVIKS